MIIIGSDFHPEFQQIAWGDTDTGEFREQPLRHRQEAESRGCGEHTDARNWNRFSCRRGDLLELLDRLNPTLAELTQAVGQEAEKCPEARWLMTHPGVGALTGLAFVLIIGKVERFPCGKQIASDLGLVPREKSSGKRRRLGHITKQGSSLLRFLLGEAAQGSVRSLPEWRSKSFHRSMRRGRKIAKVAMARRLAIRLYWMGRKGWDYAQVKKFGSHAGQPETGDGVPQNIE